MDDRRKFYRKMFLAGAIWNWIAAASLFVPDDVARTLIGASLPIDPIGKQIFGAFVIVFGIGYYIVSTDISRNEGIVVIGIIGKSLMFALFIFHVLRDDIAIVLAVPITIDLIFAILFAEFLWRGRMAIGLSSTTLAASARAR